MDETTCSSHTCSRELLVYCSDTAPCLVDTIVKGKTRKKNKKGKKRQSAACQMKTDSECTLVTAEQLSPSQHLPEHLEKRSAGSKNKKKSQKTRIILPATSQASSAYQEEPSGSQKASAQSACDQSTQTESPQLQSFQTLSTQTPPIQGIHSPPTESKSTQTKHSSFPLQQAYWGRSFTDQSTDEQETQSSSRNRHLTVLSWNIDCLDSENISHRVKGLLSQFGKYRADVVLLQELVPGCLTILQNIMKDYQVLQGSEDGYFTAILLRKDRVQLLQSNIVKYPTTEMGRNLLIAHVSFLGHPLCIMTSHLESCKSNSQERLNQLRRVWKWIKEAPEDHTVIFGGDTNLRDWEVKKLGGLPYGISDVWEMLGEPEESKYTWDTSINDNKEIPHSICLRFDRLFLRAAAEGAQLRPESMTLIGLEKLKCDYFISDHWGILCTFKFEASEEQRVND
ncbi:tyrosyl-DNA phosphodiesterase 2 isoform X1 [Carassius auratus]|uniref:Tyrosyl-DNA phosphodiesterase 2 n=1 Tax=Carassius auratus TaxID=7957 RepID=A0A6P6LHL5_CARAU|nr:tyrosyl-DNA phosphodiesterase 2-like isoform X1 [Carassius auratus]XP_026084076.1 tyrosyl-DNA phosphodiesterase 2-like isoform X1 [Carassius auratus]XP_026084077.1 tyrosyl-DNA phosphodiesterase 2-like isoform X1 [Carassius auratus]XP_026084078.1 tyrosyl-DNA phosphodiesterase 2-like isoform X1 [Carassius auratus]XP_026084079.1 tyrosyl-DNA phosphodiesterase 2-like isoform X1 [Carassius auratus]XP_026084080.1 tyrosyl-DNA phosphodiesterase 2-like isoform X1 [Carassius auratus]XP_026084081.1 ty